jgi:glucan phosphoethanolaminetransferase (alkaline phosphatase superfamily)
MMILNLTAASRTSSNVRLTSVCFQLLLEASVFFVPAAAFLSYYIAKFDHPIDAAISHTSVVVALVLTALALRLYAGSSHWLRALTTVVVGSLSFAQLMVYAVMTIGLIFWERIPTWAMIRTYVSTSWRESLDVLGIAPWLPIAATVLVACAVLVGIAMLHRWQRWPSQANRQMGSLACVLILIFASVAVIERLYVVGDGRYSNLAEPLSLAMVPIDASLARLAPDLLTRHNGEREQRLAKEYAPNGAPPTRNVVLIVVDALRPDRMSLFGHNRQTTPYLDRICRDNVRCQTRRAVAACGESYCGLMSLARGKPFHDSAKESLRLSQVLRANGYRHLLLLSGDHTSYYGLGSALGPAESYWDSSLDGGYANDDSHLLTRAAQLPRWEGQPVFMQFHLMSTHALGKRHATPYQPSKNYYGMVYASDSESSKASFGNYYDNGVQQTDAVVEELIRTLTNKGYLNDGVVFITADHGEMLGEHGLVAHTHSVHQPVLEVPFVMMRFGYDGKAWIPGVRAQIDVAPTLLDELGMAAPFGWSGIPASTNRSHDFIDFLQGRYVGLVDVRDQARPRKFWHDRVSGVDYYVDLNDDPKEERASVSIRPSADEDVYRSRIKPYLLFGKQPRTPHATH